MKNKKIALLIDAENISANYIEGILSEITEYGIATYKRMYGDFTSPTLNKWNEKAIEHSIVQIQQPRYSKAKNAADIMLVIDAMDILYAGKVEGFCIVSSDSDFTRLVNRLCEDGMEVIGMGNNNASGSLKAACTEFKSVQILVDREEEAEEAETISPREEATIDIEVHRQKVNSEDTKETQGEEQADSNIKLEVIKEAIKGIISRKDAKGKSTGLGEIGSQLVKMYSDFDIRNYGYKSLTTFLEDMEEFEVVKSGAATTIRIRVTKVSKQEIEEYIISELIGKKPVDLGLLGQKVHERYKQFKVQDYGYTKFERFISSMNKFEVQKGDAHLQQNIVILKTEK